MNKNGYFRTVIRDDKIYLQFFPQNEDGKPLDVKEVIAYLDDLGYDELDLAEINRAVTNSESGSEFYIGASKGYEINEKDLITVSQDAMLVYCRFFPPSEKGKLLSKEDILDDLKFRKITVGIQMENIQLFLTEREYCKEYLLAKGVPPVHGRDAKIEYFFNTNLSMKPKRNEDGTVDYHQLNTISRVEAGQCLAKLTKEEAGMPGKNVFGGELPPRTVKSLKFSYANNIRISKDGTELISDVTGHVSLVNDKVFVSNVYEVPADVDNGTGDIIYDGNVSVKGNVKSGFLIEAKGDIVVEGVVEGAKLVAGGQIIVKRGIHGMTKGRLEAKGNIITKFIENAIVVAGGYVETESILHSQVSARTDIKVGGKKGFVTGGVIRAGNIIDAQNIGSEMGSATRIEVGVDPSVKERFVFLQKEIVQINKEMEQIRPILQNYTEKMGRQEKLSPEKVKQVQALVKTFKEKQQKQQEMNREADELNQMMSSSVNAKVKVRGTIYPGVWVSISDLGTNIKEPRSYAQVVKDKGEIVIRPL